MIPHSNSNKTAPIRIGAVSYLNTKPLVETLGQRLGNAGQLSLALPSQLASQLADGELDIGLIPAIEYFRGPNPNAGFDSPTDGYRMISNACIACRGGVRSVRLFFRVPPRQVKSIAIDEGSKSSVGLASILMKMRYDCEPILVPLPIEADPDEVVADAVLVIGDRAMHPDRFRSFIDNWDLGLEWYRETSLPFVFAMWVGRPSVADSALAEKLEAARDDGLDRIDFLCEKFASQYALSIDSCREYLSTNLCFRLGQEELEGLKSFYRMAVELELTAKSPSPSWNIVSPSITFELSTNSI